MAEGRGEGLTTQRISLNLNRPDTWTEPLQQAVECLRGGQLVAFPTDTVYGIAADPWNEAALSALYRAKGRPEEKPIALLVGDKAAVKTLTPTIQPPPAERWMERFWPGPLTLVIEADPRLSKILTAGRPTIGVRMPDHPLALALLRAFGGPLAVTSANLSGEPDLCTGEAVEAALQGRIPLVLDGGKTPGGSPSTVIDATVDPPRLLREGPISFELLLNPP